MRSFPLTRAHGIVALVITVTLGGIFLIGRSVAQSLRNGDASAPNATAAARPAAGTGSAPAADGPAGRGGAPETRADQTPAHPAGRTGPPTAGGGPATGPSGSPTGPAGGHPTPRPTASPGPRATESAGATKHTAAERPRLPLQEGGGPYGSRSTTGSHEVALTFDDGPDPNYTPQTLELLRKYQVQATFCLVGANVQRYPELVRAIAADGHTLCNHSWSHDLSLGRLPAARIEADLVRTNEALREAVPDARIAYFRQPGGNWTANVVAVAQQLGMTSLHWAVDPQDWRRPGAGSISATVTGGAFGGAIILLHDAGGDRQQTVSALGTILPNLTRRFVLAALPNGADPPDRRALGPGNRPG